MVCRCYHRTCPHCHGAGVVAAPPPWASWPWRPYWHQPVLAPPMVPINVCHAPSAVSIAKQALAR